MSKQFAGMPFNLRNCDDEKKARMGVVECVTHKLIEPFQVLYEKEGKNVFVVIVGYFELVVRLGCCRLHHIRTSNQINFLRAPGVGPR